MSHGSLRQVGAVDGYLPPQDELTAPWWDATRERRLVLQSCSACGEVQHHPRHVCTSCGATDALGWVGSEGAGVVDTFTVVHRAPRPDLETPYVIARVRLDDGPVLLTRVVAEDGSLPDVAIGDAVRLAWSPLADGRALPVFTQVEES
ncbi:MAG: Zn-ribbon domain-containing OB-fold protein [Candidatus Nanopelagicales bacterium]